MKKIISISRQELKNKAYKHAKHQIFEHKEKSDCKAVIKDVLVSVLHVI